ncbi:hypothetical protein FBQ82_14430, partial [Anaerolineae bacterium CFX7]|nr:hypothetical protein [Anaerolineae bacterium CFX7]
GGLLNSYLIEISAEVLATRDSETGAPLVSVILDKAGQKGTGLWTAVSSLELGCPAPTIAEAVYARSLSTLKEQRLQAAQLLRGTAPTPVPAAQRETVIGQLHDALYCAKICAYAQGFDLMKTAAREQGWQLDFAEIAKIWRAGCIIRAELLEDITNAYRRNPALPNLLVERICQAVVEASARKLLVCNVATERGETDRYAVEDYLQALGAHCDGLEFDGILINDKLTGTLPPQAQIEWVTPRDANERYVFADVVDDERPWRHDSVKLARAILRWYAKGTKSATLPRDNSAQRARVEQRHGTREQPTKV